MVLSLLNALVFALLGIIHIYWVLGGKWGLNAAVPTDEKGQQLFKPSKFGTLIVGLGLLLFGCINLFYTQWISLDTPMIYLRYGILIIAVIFALRSIGDFRYVGFSKRYKSSLFAQLDSKYFSPLCLLLALSHLALYLF